MSFIVIPTIYTTLMEKQKKHSIRTMELRTRLTQELQKCSPMQYKGQPRTNEKTQGAGPSLVLIHVRNRDSSDQAEVFQSSAGTSVSNAISAF